MWHYRGIPEYTPVYSPELGEGDLPETLLGVGSAEVIGKHTLTKTTQAQAIPGRVMLRVSISPRPGSRVTGRVAGHLEGCAIVCGRLATLPTLPLCHPHKRPVLSPKERSRPSP